MPGISIGGVGGGVRTDYDTFEKKYRSFGHPEIQISIAGKDFRPEAPMSIGNIEIEMTCGYEASVATFRIANAVDEDSGEFRYASMKKQLVLGNAIEIKLGYLGRVETVFIGFIAGVVFGYDVGDTAYIEVTAMDLKGIMMANNYSYQLKAKSFGEAVSEVLKKNAYESLKNGKAFTSIKVTDTPDKKSGGGDKAAAETVEMVAESDYEFVVKAAKRYNYEFYVDRGEVLFRKAKDTREAPKKLAEGKGILEFRIEYSITGLVGQIEARNINAADGKLMAKKVKFNNAVSTGSKAKGLISKGQMIYIDPSITSDKDAEARANSLLEKISYRVGRLECECIGIPDLRPGTFMEVAGLGKPVDNKFYITNITHKMNQDRGYRLKIRGIANAVVK